MEKARHGGLCLQTQRQEDPWSHLTSQPCLLGKLLVKERPYLKEQDGGRLKKTPVIVLWTLCNLHAHLHPGKCALTHTLTNLKHTHTHTHKGVYNIFLRAGAMAQLLRALLLFLEYLNYSVPSTR